jgi:hypothetical protein
MKEEHYRKIIEKMWELVDWLEEECQSTETAKLSHSFAEDLMVRLADISYLKSNLQPITDNRDAVIEKLESLVCLIENRQEIEPERYLELHEDLNNELSALKSESKEEKLPWSIKAIDYVKAREEEKQKPSAEEILARHGILDVRLNQLRPVVMSNVIDAMKEYRNL